MLRRMYQTSGLRSENGASLEHGGHVNRVEILHSKVEGEQSCVTKSCFVCLSYRFNLTGKVRWPVPLSQVA